MAQEKHLVPTLAALPSVDKLLQQEWMRARIEEFGQTLVTRAIRQALDELRARFMRQALKQLDLQPQQLRSLIDEKLGELTASRIQKVINLTGTVLHTNLGRALLPESAIQAVTQAMRNPVNLEYDLSTGRRGDRDDLIVEKICALTGAEDATVVNNNAAAVFLLLNTLAQDREVVVSRGELVEIGGSFRIPDIMARAGVRLHEVGTTNRTHLYDYEQAINESTAMLMKVHCSNYEVQGFSKEVDIAQLAALGARHDIPATVDLGSGTLIDMQSYGLPDEPTVQQNLAKGAQVVTFSGDKLLGGPQAGLIVGDKSFIQRIKSNPLKRMLRVGKMTLAALEAVLDLYQQPEHLVQRLTTLRYLTRSDHEIKAQAERLQPLFQQWAGAQFELLSQPMHSQIGSGALPVESLPSYGLCFRYRGAGRANQAAIALAERLRNLSTPVIGRLQQQSVFLDMRCLTPEQEADLVRILQHSQ